jgi:hypothetical protein
MAELRPFTPPPAVGPVSGPRERPRRFVDDGRGGGYWTALTVEEEQAANARLNAERNANIAAGLAYTPSAVAAATAAREANELRAFQERWPDPRQSLRDAHNALREAADALRQCQEHAITATAHVGQCEVEAAHAQAAVETIRQAQTARLRQQLTGRASALAAVPAIDDPVETEAMASAEKARRSLIVARAAAADLSGTVREAETAVAAAKRQIEAAAKAVCVEALRQVRIELAALEEKAERVRRHSWDLAAAGDYAPARWAAHLRKLLDDPEAFLEPL